MQQNNTEITLSWRFNPEERQTVADMYWLAFQEILKIPLGPTQKAITFLTAVCDPNFALVARDTAGNILGVAGIKTAKGGLIGGSFAQLRDVYGTWGATWRAAMLSVLERPRQTRRPIDGRHICRCRSTWKGCRNQIAKHLN